MGYVAVRDAVGGPSANDLDDDPKANPIGQETCGCAIVVAYQGFDV